MRLFMQDDATEATQQQTPAEAGQAPEQQAQATQEQASNGKTDLADLPSDVQKYIAELRQENASFRKDRNNLSSRLEKFENGFKSMFGEGEENQVDPAEALPQLESQIQDAMVQNEILNVAIQSGISAEHLDYFNFSMMQALNELEEGDEFTEDMLNEVVSRVKGISSGGGMATTSVQGQGQGQVPHQGNEQITQEEFNMMTVGEKSALYTKDRAAYDRLIQNFKPMR